MIRLYINSYDGKFLIIRSIWYSNVKIPWPQFVRGHNEHQSNLCSRIRLVTFVVFIDENKDKTIFYAYNTRYDFKDH